MYPVLRTGDEVTLVPVGRNDICVGDILIFAAANGKKIIHRVVRLDPLQTRGDNCRKDDLPVPESSPLYRAVSFRRKIAFTPLTCGERGVQEFMHNQRSLRFRLFLRKIAGLNPFKIPFRSLKKSTFADRTVYYAGKRPVAWTDSEGWHWMRFARYFVEGPSEEPEDQ